MSALDIPSIDARLARATPGPWRCDTNRNHAGDDNVDLVVAEALGWGNVCELRGPESQTARDMVFIAHAREDVADLLAEVKRLRAAAVTAGEALAFMGLADARIERVARELLALGPGGA